MSTRCAVDIGGTFTDLVYLDEASGSMGLAKSSTTPGSFEQGVMNAIGETDLEAQRANRPDLHNLTNGEAEAVRPAAAPARGRRADELEGRGPHGTALDEESVRAAVATAKLLVLGVWHCSRRH